MDVPGKAESCDEKDGASATFLHSTFEVSWDRNTAVTDVYNTDPPDSFRPAGRPLDIWTK
ncbi:hypothetical protein ACFUKV_11560 [Streptomyces paradoxus]|uniref:hypothetical protein n=1 Tax=Streptomyces paradoxus TaxID=66375 RepID=UPI00362A3535